MVDELVTAVAMAGGDGEASRNGKQRAAATLEKMKAGEETTGLTKRLIELLELPKEVIKTFRKWLDRDSAVELSAANERRAKQVAANIEIGDDITEPIVPTIMTLDEMLKRLIFVGDSGVLLIRPMAVFASEKLRVMNTRHRHTIIRRNTRARKRMK